MFVNGAVLQRDVAAEHRVLRAIHVAHPPPPIGVRIE
jgi:hypothetical protein